MLLILSVLACAPGRSNALPAADPAPQPCPRVFLGQPGIASLPGLHWEPGQEPEGLDPELVLLLGQHLGCELQRVGEQASGYPTELRFTLLEEGVADLSVFQFSVTPERGAADRLHCAVHRRRRVDHRAGAEQRPRAGGPRRCAPHRGQRRHDGGGVGHPGAPWRDAADADHSDR